MSVNYKKSVPPDFICISQEYGEEHCPFPSTTRRSDNRRSSGSIESPLSQGNPLITSDIQTVITQQSSKNDNDSDGFMSVCSAESLESPDVVAIPNIKEKVTPKNWLNRKTEKEKAKHKLKSKGTTKLTKAMLNEAMLKEGAMVKTQDSNIADFDPNDPPRKGFRRQRVWEFGTILRPSRYYKKCWVVFFEKLNITATCGSSTLKFVASSSPSFRFKKNQEGKIVLTKIDRNKDENESILRDILNTKVHKSVTTKDYTYSYLCKSYQKQYAWLTSSKLRDYVHNHKDLSSITKQSSSTSSSPSKKTGTWFEVLLKQDTIQDHTKGFSPRKDLQVRKFLHNNHKHAINSVNVNKSDETSKSDSIFARRNHGQEEDEFVVHDNNIPAKFPTRSEKPIKKGYKLDDDVDNHGIACTCCGIHFPEIVIPSDISLMLKKREEAGFHTMIEKVVKHGKSRHVTVKVFPQPISPDVWKTRDFVNSLNRKTGKDRRFNAFGKFIADPMAVRLFDVCNLQASEKKHEYAKNMDIHSFPDNDSFVSILASNPEAWSIKDINEGNISNLPSSNDQYCKVIEESNKEDASKNTRTTSPAKDQSSIDNDLEDMNSSSDKSSSDNGFGENSSVPSSNSQESSDHNTGITYDQNYCYHNSVIRSDGRPNFCTCWCRESDIEESSEESLSSSKFSVYSHVSSIFTNTPSPPGSVKHNSSSNSITNTDTQEQTMQVDNTSRKTNNTESSPSVSSFSTSVEAKNYSSSSFDILSESSDMSVNKTASSNGTSGGNSNGTSDGNSDGTSDGNSDGALVGNGNSDGTSVGNGNGALIGNGNSDGTSVGNGNGTSVGNGNGASINAQNTTHKVIDLTCDSEVTSDDNDNDAVNSTCE